MNTRLRLFRRANGVFYCEDAESRKQQSLRTKDWDEAERLVNAKNEATLQPRVNLQIARACLIATDPEMSIRTWQHAFNEIVKTKTRPTRRRWLIAAKDKAFDLIRDLPILETKPQHFLKALESGTVSTNVYFRSLHNFVWEMNWLPWLVIVKKQWPRVRYKERRAITLQEHLRIIAGERRVCDRSAAWT